MIDKYESIINKENVLKKVGSTFKIIENNPGSQNKLLEVMASGGFGFTLDIPSITNWAFLKTDCPSGIKKVCDGIIVYTRSQETYFILIDLKSKKKGTGTKQILSSRFLCEWLNNLIDLHLGNFNKKPNFIGLICLAGRNTPSKGTTTHNFKCSKIDTLPKYSNMKIFTFYNQGKISVDSIIQKFNGS